MNSIPTPANGWHIIPLWFICLNRLIGHEPGKGYTTKSFHNGRSTGRWPWVVELKNGRLGVDLSLFLEWVIEWPYPIFYDLPTLTEAASDPTNWGRVRIVKTNIKE